MPSFKLLPVHRLILLLWALLLPVVALKALGFNVATLTCNPVALLKTVEEDQTVDFPLLHDEAVKHVNAFDIRNTDYAPGNFACGIAQPGIMLISPDGTILRKFAEENYRMRPDFADVIAAARAL